MNQNEIRSGNKEMSIPKLHGWITPEYAIQMIDEMTNWLIEIGEIPPNINMSWWEKQAWFEQKRDIDAHL